MRTDNAAPTQAPLVDGDETVLEDLVACVEVDPDPLADFDCALSESATRVEVFWGVVPK